MKKLSKLLTVTTLATLPLLPVVARAQPPVAATIKPNYEIIDPLFLGRAQNLARQAAIKVNGGLSNYRPASAAFGPAIESPHIQNDNGTITFIIQGGAVGYAVPTQETVVTVAPNNSVVVDYNGPIRAANIGEPVPQKSPESGIGGDTFLIRAQNLARQTAVELNGGLEDYRPESSMFGRTENTPYAKNADGSVTFTFTGSPPDASTPAVQSIITVTRNNTVTVNYNGPIQ
ncbi:hypothetical protein [Acaryochloris sp. CCMEE 5410]|uniref:hypothetical protein n=1 Tax=Acaryochloris sp. CCMEE 5410 TaxID=310037 RepID=UPI0002484CC4|nr:hypothetical protein [Acaryochloris sp. CCMEE 5410]KAI9132327.1 purine nucleoside permease [Acaryochloris sp. CCMEE 5410]